MKLHRKIKHNEKVCRAQDSGSYAQVKVTIRSEVKFALSVVSYPETELSEHGKLKDVQLSVYLT